VRVTLGVTSTAGFGVTYNPTAGGRPPGPDLPVHAAPVYMRGGRSTIFGALMSAKVFGVKSRIGGTPKGEPAAWDTCYPKRDDKRPAHR
jgi:hypothetical protein